MNRSFLRRLTALLLILTAFSAPHAGAWTDQAHMALGCAAGFRAFHNCTAPDLSHAVAAMNDLPRTESQAHFFNLPADEEITAADVYAQLDCIGRSREECPEGYLLGAILHGVRQCREKTESGDYDDEYYAVLLHYLGDLSQPLHMSPYDDFNRRRHFACDDILSDPVAEYPVFAVAELAAELTVEEICFADEGALVDAVVTLARQSQALAGLLRAEDRPLTREEALLQVSRSATLARSILIYCGKLPSGGSQPPEAVSAAA